MPSDIKKAHPEGRAFPKNDPGDVLLSHAVAHAVPSALRGLTSVFGMGTGVALSLWSPGKNGNRIVGYKCLLPKDASLPDLKTKSISKGQASRPISTGKLNALLHLHIQPINLVVSEGSSATEVEGYLIFGWASRLDAFSAYPFRV